MAATPGSQHWQQLEKLFYAALELAPGEREAFLDRSCQGNADLRREVESLLEGSEKTWGFLENPLRAAAEEIASSSPAAGERIGDYKIIRLLGEGGMGQVYLAARADKLYKQQVAIKLVLGGLWRSRDLMLRFSAERQILANLSHPNIARLLDAGITANGEHYLVMKYVAGEPIDCYVSSHNLPIRERLRLFQTVCSAVEYAHRNLVVHRDIKPANILVTADRVPKLLDFGIAKLLQASEHAGLTQAHERLMTPEYASPEQLRGEPVTTATDVYGLGILLYLLLTGTPPFKLQDKSPMEAARIVCDQPPTRPSSQLAPRPEAGKLRGDLDNIVLKSLRKEPERRYVSVEALSDDVRRYLEGYPVQAAADSWPYRAGKFVRRHKGAVAATAVMTLAILAFSVGMGLFAQRARRERMKAERERAFLSSLFTAATPDVARGKSLTVRELLDQGAKRINQELASEPEVHAAMPDSVGSSYMRLGVYEQARPLLERALEIRRRTLGSVSLDTAETGLNLAQLLEMQGEYDKAERLYREGLATREKLLKENNPLVGEAQELLGECLYLESRNDEAEKTLRAAIGVLAPDSEVREAADNYLALTLERQGKFDEAVRLLREATESARRRQGEDSPDYATSLHNLAGALSDTGNMVEAEATERKVLEIRRRVSGKDHPDVGFSLNNLGWFLLEEGKWAEAEPFLREGIELGRTTLGERHPRFAGLLNNWGRVLQQKGDYKQAEQYYEQALAILRASGQEQSWAGAKIEANLGLLRLDMSDYPAAEKHLREALDLRRKLGNEDNPDVASSLIDLGVAQSFLGDPSAAEASLRQGLEIRRKILRAGHIKIIAADVRLGEVLTAEGKIREAEPLRGAVDSAHRSPFPVMAWQVGEAESALGVCLMRKGQTREADDLIKRSRDALKMHPQAALRKQALSRAVALLSQH